MSDYIERQAVIDAIHCDITITGRQNAELVASTIGAFVDRIKALPPADVVTVVRCRDCRKCSYDSLFDHWWCNSTLSTRRVKPDDFCSYGERGVSLNESIT